MTTMFCPDQEFSIPSKVMERKKTKTEKLKPIHQMSLRIPDVDFVRIEAAATRLGLDPTSLVRMIIKENLATYERRAEQVQ